MIIIGASSLPDNLPPVVRENTSDDDCQRASVSTHLRCPKRPARHNAVFSEDGHEKIITLRSRGDSERQQGRRRNAVGTRTLPNRLMTAFEVAEVVGCHEESVRRAYLCGQLKRQRFGVRSWRFQPADVRTDLAGRTNENLLKQERATQGMVRWSGATKGGAHGRPKDLQAKGLSRESAV